MALAGSFVAERILGTSGPTFVNFNCADTATHMTVQQCPREDKRVAAKARKTFRARAKPVSSSNGGGLIRLVTVTALMAAVGLIAPLSLFHIGLIGPVSRLFWINPDRAFQDPNRRSENTGLH